jgi:hypothetical protein
MQNQILAVLIVFYRRAKKAIIIFFTQDKFLTPGGPYIFHNLRFQVKKFILTFFKDKEDRIFVNP